MKKVVKIKESELVNLIDKLIKESVITEDISSSNEIYELKNSINNFMREKLLNGYLNRDYVLDNKITPKEMVDRYNEVIDIINKDLLLSLENNKNSFITLSKNRETDQRF
jgi:hypothetical protein